MLALNASKILSSQDYLVLFILRRFLFSQDFTNIPLLAY